MLAVSDSLARANWSHVSQYAREANRVAYHIGELTAPLRVGLVRITRYLHLLNVHLWQDVGTG